MGSRAYNRIGAGDIVTAPSAGVGNKEPAAPTSCRTGMRRAHHAKLLSADHLCGRERLIDGQRAGLASMSIVPIGVEF
jgi:hypothetical protein